jgi:hypothetical protein
MSSAELIEEARRRNERRAQGKPITPEQSAEGLRHVINERDARLEKDIQRDVYKRYRNFGCEIYWLSQARETRQTPGVPDLIVFHPRSATAWYHEVKTPTGTVSPAQLHFLELAAGCGIRVVVGGVNAAEEQLVIIGAAYRELDGHLEPRR